MRRKPPRIPEVVYRPTRFEAKGDHIVAVIDLGFVERLGGNLTIGIRFVSPEHLLEFTSSAMDAAARVWPDNPWIKEYRGE